MALRGDTHTSSAAGVTRLDQGFQRTSMQPPCDGGQLTAYNVDDRLHKEEVAYPYYQWKGAAPVLFMDEKEGTLALARDCYLSPHMPARDVYAARHALGCALPEMDGNGIIPFPSCEVEGGRVAPVAFVREERLCAVNLSVVSVGQKTSTSAEQQRAFLFSLLCAKDPCPDTQRTCGLACSFGNILVSTDPRTGFALARIAYR